jgi:NDP-sugar pyrophosphorylase family protein
MKAMLLCAGCGTRLGELTETIPKPMLPIAGKPLLAHLIEYVASHGFDELMINLHYRPEMIRGYFGDGAAFGVKLHYSYEETLLGTAGALKKVEPFFADVDEFLVVYGDLLIDQPLAPLLALHRRERAAATLLVHQRPGSNSLIRVGSDQRILDFIERPTDEQRRAAPYPWVNSGVQLLSPRLLDRIPAYRPADLPRDLYVPLVRGKRFFALPLSGYRCAIDSPERYRQAQADAATLSPPDRTRAHSRPGTGRAVWPR